MRKTRSAAFVVVCVLAGLPGAWALTGECLGPPFNIRGVSDAWRTSLVVSTDDGLFRRASRSGTWTPLENGLPTGCCGPLETAAFDPSILFLGGSDGLSRSEDGGSHWEAVGAGLSEGSPQTIESARGPSGEKLVYTTIRRCQPDSEGQPTCHTRLFSSVDQGGNWTEITGLLENGVVLASVGSTVYAMADQGLFRSLDEGQTWDLLAADICRVNALAIDPRDPRLLFAASGEGGPRFVCGDVLRSADGGMTWNPSGLGRDFRSVIVDPFRPGRVFASSIDFGRLSYPPAGVVESVDGGVSWSDLSFYEFCDSPFIFHLALGPRGFSLFAGTSAGVAEITLQPLTLGPPSARPAIVRRH